MTPYDPSMYWMSGTYKLVVGDLFYVGSTLELGGEESNHRAKLAAGEHPNPLLQAEYNAGGHVRLYLMLEVPRKHDDSDHGHMRRLRFREQLLLDDLFGTEGCANRSPDAGFHHDHSGRMKQRWADPEFRETMLAKLRETQSRPVSPETRAKLSEAKKGKRNARSKPCMLLWKGETLFFESAGRAAHHMGVSQQVMDLWLRRKLDWPGEGPRKPRSEAGKRLVGLTGCYGSAGDLPEVKAEEPLALPEARGLRMPGVTRA